MTREPTEPTLPGHRSCASKAESYLSIEGETSGRRLVDSRQVVVAASTVEAFAPIVRVGGDTGWYFANWLWRLRGRIDELLGGVGMRRGRPNHRGPSVGDAIDFWRVEAFEADHLLRLTAEMKVPGRAWLQFEVGDAPGGAFVRQTAIFDPEGLLGLLYWYLLYPVHTIVFAGMLRGIVSACGAHGVQGSTSG